MIGRDFDIALLAAVAQTDEDTLIDLCDAAVEAAVLQTTDDPDRYTFAHALIEHTLYDGLSAARRAARPQSRRRGTSKRWPARRREPGPVSSPTTGPSRPTGRHRRRPSDYAPRGPAIAPRPTRPADDAIELVRATRVGAASTGRPEPDRRQRVEMLIGLGDAQRQLGDPEYSETLLEACELAREVGDGARMARAAEANTRGFASGVGQVDQRRVDALEAALELCAEDSQRASLLSLLAVELCYDAALERRLSLSGEAVRLARESGDRHALAWCMARRQIAIAAPETLDERLAEAGEMVALADELDDPMLRYWAHVWRAMDALEVGDFETQALDRGRSRRRSPRRPDSRCFTGSTPSPQRCWRRWPATSTSPRRSPTVRPSWDPSRASPTCWRCTRRRSTSSATSRGASTRCWRSSAAMAETPLLDAYSSALAFSYIELDQTEKARALLERFAADDFEVASTISARSELCTLTEVAARLGDQDAAAILYERLLPWRDQLCYSGVTLFGTIERFLGLGATCIGRYEDAEDHFRRSAATCEQDRGANLARPDPPRVGADAPARRARRPRGRRLAADPGPRVRDAIRLPLTRAAGAGRNRGSRPDRFLRPLPLNQLAVA